MTAQVLGQHCSVQSIFKPFYLQFPYQPKCVMCFLQSLEPVDYYIHLLTYLN